MPVVRADERRAGHGVELPTTLVEDELHVGEGLQTSAETRLRLANALRDGADPTPFVCVQVEHAVGFAEPERAEHDRLGGRSTGSFLQCRRGLAGAAASPGAQPGGIGGRPRPFIAPVPRICLYTTEWCGYCVRARALLDARGLAYDEISLDDDPGFRRHVYDIGGRVDGAARDDRRSPHRGL